MLDNLLFTLNAVLPVILLILTGYGTKRAGLLPESFFPLLNRLCFRVLLPVMLFRNVYNVADLSAVARNWQVAVFSVLAIFSAFLLGLAVVIPTVRKPDQRGVVLQCVFRSNYAIIGLPLAESLSGGGGVPMAVASVVSAVSVPVFNVLATISLSVFTDGGGGAGKKSAAGILRKIALNPLILGTCAGMAALLVRAAIPQGPDGEPLFSMRRNLPFVYAAVEMLSRTASPAALVALGGGFTFSAAARLKGLVALGASARLVVVPALMLAAARVLGFSSDEFPALIALSGTPVAVSSVPMSAEMGGDTELAGQLVVWTTILSAASLSAIIFICARLGLVG